jgi:hypothetical protein
MFSFGRSEDCDCEERNIPQSDLRAFKPSRLFQTPVGSPPPPAQLLNQSAHWRELVAFSDRQREFALVLCLFVVKEQVLRVEAGPDDARRMARLLRCGVGLGLPAEKSGRE